MTTTFDNLDFKPHPNGTGVQARVFFPDGYGASVIKTAFSYGGKDGLFELAVLEGTEKSSYLTYSTPVTSDVEGHLMPEDVTNLLVQIEALPHA